MTSLKSIAAKLSVANLLLIGKFQQLGGYNSLKKSRWYLQKLEIIVSPAPREVLRFEVWLHVVIKMNGASQPLFLSELTDGNKNSL
jgi:hypothetical protein